jgi:thymidylate kinase
MTQARAEPIDLPSQLRAAFAALDAAGLWWTVLRESESGSTSGDVDILVEPAAADRLDPLLTDAGYRRLSGAGQGSHRFYLGYDAGRDTFVMLDVVTEVAFGRRLEFLTATAPALLARSRRIGGVAVLDTSDAFWHLLLHYLLDKRHVPPGGHTRLTRAAMAAEPTGALAAVVDGLRPGGLTSAAVLDLVRHGDRAAVESLSDAVRRQWRAREPYRVRSRAFRSRLQRAHLLGPPGPASLGMMIAILGPDGAGKTTLAEALGTSVPLPNRRIYMGVWRDYPWDRWLRPIPGARLGVRLIRLAVRSVECRYHRLRGRLVLIDRFTHDAALPIPELDWRGRVTATLVRRLSRNPDLLLILDAPAEVMYARKGEQGVPVLARDRRSYLDLANKLSNAAVIDATLAPAGVRRRAHVALWQALAGMPGRMD